MTDRTYMFVKHLPDKMNINKDFNESVTLMTILHGYASKTHSLVTIKFTNREGTKRALLVLEDEQECFKEIK